MKTAAETAREIRSIAEPVCHANGYELVDVEYTRAQSGWVVRVYIDRPPLDVAVPHLSGISFADCERLSRELSTVLDVEDPVPSAYSLEVSSPGLDRPLRTAAHFQRFAGETAKVALAEPLEGRKNFKGVLKGVEPPGPDATTVVIDVDGTLFRLPIQSIASARLVPDWDSVMKTHKEAK
jgi:ribosome maturation factor RimP